MIASPSSIDRFFSFLEFVAWAEGVEDLDVQKRGGTSGWSGKVSSRISMEGRDTGENRVGHSLDGGHAGSFFVVLSVVVLATLFVPGVSVDLLAEAAEVVVAFIIKVELSPFSFLTVEAVSGGAESDGGAAALVVIDKGISLVIGKSHETGVEEQEVGLLENLDIRNGGSASLDVAIFIESEEDSAFETVVLG